MNIDSVIAATKRHTAACEAYKAADDLLVEAEIAWIVASNRKRISRKKTRHADYDAAKKHADDLREIRNAHQENCRIADDAAAAARIAYADAAAAAARAAGANEQLVDQTWRVAFANACYAAAMNA